MALSQEQSSKVTNVLQDALRKKFRAYKPEPGEMPFHIRLLGKDRMALFSFIHSLNTNFGTSIFEPVALALAGGKFHGAHTQHVVGKHISSGAQSAIQRIMNELETGNQLPCKKDEVEMIREVCRQGEMISVKPAKVDIIVMDSCSVHLFDLKTAKPNKDAFKGLKRTMLEWIGVYLAEKPSAEVHSCIAIPYNPYAPNPYKRWTMKGMLDLKDELKVAAEFWDFLGGEGAYNDLLDIFERVGVALRPELDEYFSKHSFSSAS